MMHEYTHVKSHYLSSIYTPSPRTLARTDKFLSPANDWSVELPHGEENLHCAYTVQCVRATVSIRPLLYNKRVSAKESSTLVAPEI